jgi:methyl-accepting chemotaxis protein
MFLDVRDQDYLDNQEKNSIKEIMTSVINRTEKTLEESRKISNNVPGLNENLNDIEKILLKIKENLQKLN